MKKLMISMFAVAAMASTAMAAEPLTTAQLDPGHRRVLRPADQREHHEAEGGRDRGE